MKVLAGLRHALPVIPAIAFLMFYGGAKGQAAPPTQIAYEGFVYPSGLVLDGQSGGNGWDTGTKTLGTSCAGGLTGGHTGASWITSFPNKSFRAVNHLYLASLC